MPRVAGDEDIPAKVEELAAELVELLRAAGEAVQQDQRTLGASAVRVEPGVAERVDVRAVEVLQRAGDPDAFRVVVAGHRLQRLS